MVDDAAEGFKRVLDDHDGTFAFIHDASEVSRNCTLKFKCILFTNKITNRYDMNTTTIATSLKWVSHLLSSPMLLLYNREATCKKKYQRYDTE